MTTKLKDANGDDLIPGRCYCMATVKRDAFNPTETYEDFGSLAWFASDGRLYDANYADCEGQDITHYDFDKLILQPGNVNTNYIG